MILQHHDFSEDMLGQYALPNNCDTLVIGACKYTLMWYELDTLDQIKFVILVKNSLVTTLGFSMEQNSNYVCIVNFTLAPKVYNHLIKMKSKLIRKTRT